MQADVFELHANKFDIVFLLFAVQLLFVASIDSNQRAQVGLDDIVMSDGCCTGATLSGDPFGSK